MNAREIIEAIKQRFFEKDHGAELAALKAAARRRVTDDRVRVRLGDLLRRNGDDEGALFFYWEATEINLERDHLLRAVAILKQILLLSPEDSHAHLELARCFEDLGRLREAALCFQAAADALDREGRHDHARETRCKADDLFRACNEVEYIQPQLMAA